MARRKKQDEEPDNLDNINNDDNDNFGLPEVEYEPIRRDELHVDESEPKATPEDAPTVEYVDTVEEVVEEDVIEEEHEYSSNTSPYDDEPSQWPKIIVITLLLLLVAVGAWYFASYRPKQLAAERVRQEEIAREELARKLAAENVLAETKRQEDEKRRADSLAALTPLEGSVESLSDRTGRYYIVVASAIDDDLIMDFANKLKVKGVTCKIIPPFGRTKFSRLAIDSKDNYDEAQTTADGMKGGDYGNEIWVVKF